MYLTFFLFTIRLAGNTSPQSFTISIVFVYIYIYVNNVEYAQNMTYNIILYFSNL